MMAQNHNPPKKHIAKLKRYADYIAQQQIGVSLVKEGRTKKRNPLFEGVSEFLDTSRI